MAKRKKKLKRSKSTPVKYNSNVALNFALNAIAAKRTGGAINIKGIGFQLNYSCNLIVRELIANSSNVSIRLEGIEDVDVIHIDNNRYFQLKSSINKIDAGVFWKLGVLQNFLTVHKENPNCDLFLIHNSSISEGNLSLLNEKNIPQKVSNFWKNKFEGELIEISDISFDNFLKSIHIKKVSEVNLNNETLKILVEHFSLNSGVEEQYLKALFYNVFNWSKDRKVISYNNLLETIQNVTDSFSKSPTNLAIENDWIHEVKFDIKNIEEDAGYFDGKAALPIHIANELPIRRSIWESKIKTSLNDFDICVIKASSGQGKSTLAWQVSKNLMDSGSSIYGLNHCLNSNEVTSVLDFLKTRLTIGKIPIVVIDGLNYNKAAYQDLLVKSIGLPIKFIITTREEDWYRYGADVSNLRLDIIDITLSSAEAKDIYDKLRKKNKIHKNISKWEPIWEKVSSKGLLIEFVYLLTKGEMIHERLEQQIKILNKEKEANLKVEILRQISLSDILNIKVRTRELIEYVKKEIGFSSDRGEILKQLEKEYYIKFDSEFVEGLHPIRSQHLVDLLHQNISISDSLLNLLSIIEEEFIYDFFITVPGLIKAESKHFFYDGVANQMIKSKFSNMVYVIDGIMHSEPYRFWLKNKRIFDEVFEKGGLELFVSDTLPFTKLETIKGLFDSAGDSFPNLSFYLDKLNELSSYKIDDSDVAIFAKKLSHLLKQNSNNISDFEGLGFLVKWFKQLSIPLSLNINFKDEDLLNILRNGSIQESGELFNYLNLSSPKQFINFTNKYKFQIISTLKRETNSLTIEEEGEDIHIGYLLDNDAEKTNSSSVYRIQEVFNFLPNYTRYCTKAIILPFPNEEIYDAVVQNSIKTMPRENIVDTFDVHINQIWNRTITSQYESSSLFDWQEESIELRKKGLEVTKLAVRFFESRIEGNVSRVSLTIKKLYEVGMELSKILMQKKSYPKSSKKYFDKEPFADDLKKIDSWNFSLNNLINQITNILQPKSERERNVALENLKSVFYNLNFMQSAFNSIQESTFKYFVTDNLVHEEKEWFERFLITALYYSSEFLVSEKTVSYPKQVIKDWWKLFNLEKLQKVLDVVNESDISSDFKFHLPNKILTEDKLTNVVIGVDRLDLNAIEEDSLNLLSGLSNLAFTDIDFFTFININDKEAISAFRVNRSFFEKIDNYLKTGNFEETSYGDPYPIELEDSILDSLDDIKFKKVKIDKEDKILVETMFEVWKLSEYRTRLNSENEIEKNWLAKLEAQYQDDIKNQLSMLEKNDATIISDFLNKKIELDKNQIISILSDRINSINSKIYG